MAYLRHYQARGDPFLGGLIGKAFKGITGLAKGALGLGGGPSAGSIAQKVAQRLGSIPGAGAVGSTVGKAIGKIPGGAKGAGIAAAAAAAGLGVGEYMAMHGMKRRYRRMNPGNTRALRRSMRRVQSFAKLARETISFTHRVKMKKKGRR